MAKGRARLVTRQRHSSYCSREFDGVSVVLARVTPALMHHKWLDQFREAISVGLDASPSDVLSYCCMGRQDLLFLVRTTRPEAIGEIARPRGVRKVDIQYGYMPSQATQRLFTGRRQAPLSVVIYGKLADEAEVGSEAGFDHAEFTERVGKGSHVIRLLGWNDVLVMLESDTVRHLLERATEVWDMRVGLGAPQAANEPLFARTYTVLGIQLGRSVASRFGALAKIDSADEIRAPRVEMRIRPGLAWRVREQAGKCLAVDGAHPVFSQELGHEDGTVTFFGPDPPVPPKVNTRKFLEAYYLKFLKRVKHCVHSTQLCLAPDRPGQDAARVPARAKVRDIVKAHLSFDYIDLGDVGAPDGAPTPIGETLRDLLGNDITASAADCLHALYEACDWSIENEALQTTFGDLFWHLRWLVQEYWPKTAPVAESDGLPALGAFAESLGLEVKAIGDGFAQRLSGAYYGIMGYRPEHLFSHVTSLHKVPVGLWALHTALMEALTRGGPFRPCGCWLVSHGQRPFTGARESAEACYQVGQLPARGVAALESIAFDVGHEIGHMVYNRFIARVRPPGGPIAEVPFTPQGFVMFYEGALAEVATGSPLRPLDRRLCTRLAKEVFADGFAIRHFLGDRFDLLAFRVLQYIPYHDPQNAVELVVRSFVQYCATLPHGKQPGAGILTDEGRGCAPEMGEPVAQWRKRARAAGHNLGSGEAWEAFADELRKIAEAKRLPGLSADKVKEARAFVTRLEEAAAMLACYLEHTVEAAWHHSARAEQANHTRERRARQAFQELVGEWGTGADAFDARVRCYERLWHLAVEILSSNALKPTKAGNRPVAKRSPWLALGRRAATAPTGES